MAAMMPHVIGDGGVTTPPNTIMPDMDISRLVRLENGTFREETIRFNASAPGYLATNETVSDDAETAEEPRICCTAMIASCMACSEGKSTAEYCAQKPDTDGCQDKDELSRRMLGPHGRDDRSGVDASQVQRTPFNSVVRLKMGNSRCSGTLVDDDTVLTAAHCVYEQNSYKTVEVEVHPWKAERKWYHPGTWFGSAHRDCSVRARISYPCGTRWCQGRGWWGWVWWPCGSNWCTRYASPARDCTWRYESSSVLVPDAWKRTACQSSTSSSCNQADFQHDIALVKLKRTQGLHAGSRAPWLSALYTNRYDSTYTITGYPGDRSPFMMTASGPIERVDRNVLIHKIDANSGQSGAGVQSGGTVVGVHVFGGNTYDGSRRIDQWWSQVLASHY